MPDPLVNDTLGMTPCVFVNGSGGLISGLFALADTPTGVEWMALCVKLKLTSFSRFGRMVFRACTTQARPGELVLVVARLGIAAPVNRPPGSVVGMLSFSNLPQTEKRSLNV